MRNVICADCGSRDSQRTVTNGSFWIELLLLVFFILPGLIYGLWRLTTRHKACAKCGSKRLIPLDTPAGRELAARYPTA